MTTQDRSASGAKVLSYAQGRLNAALGGPNGAPRPRIALLPPLDRKSKPADAALADALIDDITLGMCAMRTVSVVAAHTAANLRSEPEWLGLLERHRVDYVLDTRTSPEGLLLQLIYLPTDTMMWAARYTLQLASLPNQRRDIARAVIGQIVDEVERNEVFYADYVKNPNAYRLYLTGRNRMKSMTLAGIQWARKAFQAAVEERSDFSPALSGLSRTYMMECLLRGRNDADLLGAAESAADIAISGNPLSPLGYREYGVARLYLGDVDDGLEALSKSMTLGPHYTDAMYSLADALVHASRPAEGLALMEQVFSLDFLPADTYYWCAASACYYLERYEESIDYIERMKHSAPAARAAAASWAMLGDLDKAASERERFLQLNPDFSLDTWLSTIPFKEKWQSDMYKEGLMKAGF